MHSEVERTNIPDGMMADGTPREGWISRARRRCKGVDKLEE